MKKAIYTGFYLLAAAFAIYLFFSCKKTSEPQITLQVTIDKITEDIREMTRSGHLLIKHGQNQVYLINLVNADKGRADLNVVSLSYTIDTIRKMFNIKKGESFKKELRSGKEERLGESGIGLSFRGFVALQREPVPPQGICGGVCCRAGCATLYCCGDDKECKVHPCDCKYDGPCPSDILPPGTLRPPEPPMNNYLDLIKSGKLQMEFAIKD